MDMRSIISKKRAGKELSTDEIKVFIGKFAKGEITDAQAAALLSYIYTNGMTEKEILDLSLEMARTGEILDFSDISDIIVDKHSTGGIGDKVSLILMPIMAALGFPVAKISSRGLGITGGTIDKLESIPGFESKIPLDKFKKNVKGIGLSIINQDLDLAPVEQKIYKLRNEIGCGDSVPIIAASLMSLKIATGSNRIVFDITCGSGTYLKTVQDAKKLARILKRLGTLLDKKVGCVVTASYEPLGYAIGDVLEMKEAIKCLQGKMTQDIGDVVVTLGSVLLELTTNVKNREQNEKTILDAIRSGRAFEKFKDMVLAQDGNIDYLKDLDQFPKARNIVPVYSVDSGFVEGIDADIVGSIARYLGAGRMNDEYDINRTAGIELQKKIGDEVKSGDILAYIHTNEDQKVMGATQNLIEAFKFSKKPTMPKSNILAEI